MRKFAANKLIRDKLPELIKTKNGTYLDCITLSETDFIDALKRKLVEEANEVLTAESQEEVIKEIADVLEVLDGIYRLMNISMQQILQEKLSKREEKGGFELGVYCRTVNVDDSDTELLKKYENNAVYPEIFNYENMYE